jgi:hypothetical protein
MKFARVFLFLLLVLSLQATAQANATVLFDIEIERAAEETRVHLKADGAIKDYRKVHLKKNVEADRPDRMYLDIKNVHLAGPIPAKQVGTALARVRTGRRADGLRVVFDSNLDELFDYTISEQPDGLLVTIREPSAADPVIADIMQEEEPGTGPEPKAEGDLSLLIVTSDSPDHAQEWLEAPPGRRISLKLLKTAKPDQEIITSFLVTGVTSDINGDYSFVVSFTLLDPYGKVVFGKRNYAKASGKAPVNPAFMIAEPALGIVLDGTDPLGDYKIIGIVEDLANNKIFRTSQKITLEQ